jgi:hypothetical protein
MLHKVPLVVWCGSWFLSGLTCESGSDVREQSEASEEAGEGGSAFTRNTGTAHTNDSKRHSEYFTFQDKKDTHVSNSQRGTYTCPLAKAALSSFYLSIRDCPLKSERKAERQRGGREQGYASTLQLMLSYNDTLLINWNGSALGKYWCSHNYISTYSLRSNGSKVYCT